MTVAYVGLGSNRGERRRWLERALEGMASLGRLVAVSSFQETEPVGFRQQPDFLNAVAALDTELEPEELHRELKALEQSLGRTASFRYGPREIDLDLLLFGNRQLSTPQLQLPHPRMAERRFVLEPLVEIAPDVVDPRSGLTARQLLAALDEASPSSEPPQN